MLISADHQLNGRRTPNIKDLQTVKTKLKISNRRRQNEKPFEMREAQSEELINVDVEGGRMKVKHFLAPLQKPEETTKFE